MGEGSRSIVTSPENPQVTVEFEQADLSIGTGRYRGAVPITKNLSMKPGGAGQPPNPMIHANVKVILRDANGKPVPMTRRLVRTWDLQPLPNATVDNLRMWHIVGLLHSEFSPFSPFPSSANERPGDTNFRLDHPSRQDAPGLQFIQATPFGILQEFLAGNGTVGGAYYQVYTLFDGSKYRVMTSRSMTLSAAEYNKLLTSIDNGTYTKSCLRFLYFMPEGASDATGAVPPAKGR